MAFCTAKGGMLGNDWLERVSALLVYDNVVMHHRLDCARRYQVLKVWKWVVKALSLQMSRLQVVMPLGICGIIIKGNGAEDW